MKSLFKILVLLVVLFSCRDTEQKKTEEKIVKKDTTIVDDSKALMPPGGYDTTQAMQRRRPKPTYSIFLQGTGVSASEIKLIWQGGTPNFIVYRLLANRLNAVSVATTSAFLHTVTGLLPATYYEFFIKDSRGVSSDTIKVPTLPGSGTGNSVWLLDFDGHTDAVRTYQPSGLSQEQILYETDSIRREWARVNPNLIVTTDEAIYAAGNQYKRMRQIFTVSWEWYGTAGGVAYPGSFTFGNNTPCWVFTSLLSYNNGYIIRAAIHEGGHTFGLPHVSVVSTVPCANWMSDRGHYGYTGCFDASQKSIINSKL